jgi:hypothetical protein
MRKRVLTLTMCAAMAAMLITGCGSGSSDTTSESSAISSSTDISNQMNENVVYGKVTAVNGQEITYEVLEQDENARSKGEKPEGSAAPDGEKPEMPEGSAAPDGEAPEKPDGSAAPDGEMPEGSAAPDGEKPEMPEGSAAPDGEMQGGGMGGFTSTGEEKTLTVEDSTKICFISRDGNTQEAALSDITEGTIIQLQYSDEEELTEIDIPNMDSKGGKDNDGKTEDSSDDNTAESTSSN